MSETTTKRLVMERKKRESREMFACELKLRPKNVKNVGTLETVPYPESVRLPNLELNFPVEPGRFRYDRGFLLQFMSVCKPASLAPLGALGLEPYNTSREGANSTHESPSASQARHTSSNAIVSSAPFRSTTGRPMFTPRGAIQGGARGGYPGQNGRARNQRGNTRGNGPRSSELHTPGSQAAIIQLVSRPEATEGPSIGTDTLDSHQRQHLRARWLIIIKYRVKALLNRLAVDNFESISKKIIGWANRSEGEKDEIFLKRIVSLVVEHAKSGAAFSELYARLCRKMVEQISSNVQDETIHDSQGQPIAGGALFRKYLLSYCHYEFECRWCPEETPISVEPEDNVAEATSQASRRHAADLNPYKATKAKRQDLGLVRFICELFRLQMLNKRAVHDCVKVLLSNIINPGEEEIVALNVIFTTIGPSLDNFKGKDHIDIYFERMQEMVKGNISWRLRFLLMDIIELRERQWEVRPQQTLAIVDTLAPDEHGVIGVDISEEAGSVKSRLNATLGAGIVRNGQLIIKGTTFAIPPKKIWMKIKNIFAGYLAKQNIEKTLVSLKGLSSEHQYILIDKLVSQAIGSGGKAVMLVEQLFFAAHKQAIVSPRAFEQGLLPTIVTIDDLSDLSLDIPKAYQWVARFIQAAGTTSASAEAMVKKISVFGEHRISPQERLMKEINDIVGSNGVIME